MLYCDTIRDFSHVNLMVNLNAKDHCEKEILGCFFYIKEKYMSI